MQRTDRTWEKYLQQVRAETATSWREDFEAAKQTALEKALAAAWEKLDHELAMVATYSNAKVSGARAAVVAIERLLPKAKV